MSTVTVTGNAWTHTGAPIPAANLPELWFRPLADSSSGDSLLVGVEVRATLNLATGSFSVQLVSEPWLRYVPQLRWVVNPSEPVPEAWSWQYAEWDWTVTPYPVGGPIGSLTDRDLSIYSVLVSLSPPPPGYRGWYLNAPGPGAPVGDPNNPSSSGTGILEMVS